MVARRLPDRTRGPCRARVCVLLGLAVGSAVTLGGCRADDRSAAGPEGAQAGSWSWDEDAGAWGWTGEGDASTSDGWVQVGDAPGADDDGWVYVGDGGGSADGSGGQADAGGGPVGGAKDIDYSDFKVPGGGGPLAGEPGAACVGDDDCNDGPCMFANTPWAYCAKTDCKAHQDCAGLLDDVDAPVCCISWGMGSSCVLQFQAEQCGNLDKLPGDDCSEGGWSDCKLGEAYCLQSGKEAECVGLCGGPGGATCDEPGTACVQGGNDGGICIPYTEGVADGTPCADDPIGGCGEKAFCLSSYPGDPFAYCATTCQEDAQCDEGFGCVVFGNGFGACIAFGDKPAGASCSDDRFGCAKGLACYGGGQGSSVCVPTCAEDVDCDGASSPTGKAMCQKGPNAPVGVCQPVGETKDGESCADNPYVCEEGAFCFGGNDVYNPNAVCTTYCGWGTDGDCPAGTQCVGYNDFGALCQADGPKQQGMDCTGDPNGCAAGHICSGPIGLQTCMKLCETKAQPGEDGACAPGAWCVPWGAGGGGPQAGKYGQCLSHGDIPVGGACAGQPDGCEAGAFCQAWGQSDDSTCVAPCGEDGSCAEGTACKSFGDVGSYCIKTGGGTQGDACVEDANSCAADFQCIGAGTPFAICAQLCAVTDPQAAKAGDPQALAGTCEAPGTWCNTGPWGGVCAPLGSVERGGGCFGDPWACEPGLTCIGSADTNPASFCSQPCAGFASACFDNEECEYLGNGTAFCVPKGGTLGHGESCLYEPAGCSSGTICIKGTPQSTCVQTCGVGLPSCPADSTCTAFPGSALKLCVPTGFEPFGPITIPI